MRTISLADAPAVIIEHLQSVNAHDLDGIMATFADDAYVNDNSREIGGAAAVRAFVAREIVGDSVTIDPVEVIEHHGQIVIRGRYDGSYEKAHLPDPLIMSNYYALDGDRIVSMAIVFNRPSPYDGPAAG